MRDAWFIRLFTTPLQIFAVLSHLPSSPAPPFKAQLHRCRPPIFAVTMTAIFHTGTRHCLFFAEYRQQPKHDGNAAVELHAHQSVRCCIGNVLEVHRFPFDQHPDGDHGIKWRGQCFCGCRWPGRPRRCLEIGHRGWCKQIRRRRSWCAGRGSRLNLWSSVQPPRYRSVKKAIRAVGRCPGHGEQLYLCTA